MTARLTAAAAAARRREMGGGKEGGAAEEEEEEGTRPRHRPSHSGPRPGHPRSAAPPHARGPRPSPPAPAPPAGGSGATTAPRRPGLWRRRRTGGRARALRPPLPGWSLPAPCGAGTVRSCRLRSGALGHAVPAHPRTLPRRTKPGVAFVIYSCSPSRSPNSKSNNAIQPSVCWKCVIPRQRENISR